jgi:hypothetical protein
VADNQDIVHHLRILRNLANLPEGIITNPTVIDLAKALLYLFERLPKDEDNG